MKLFAHEKYYGLNEEDEPFHFLYFRDNVKDFVFSLTRMKASSKIEIMVKDQIIDSVEDLDCKIDSDFFSAKVPESLQKYLAEEKYTIEVKHDCDTEEIESLKAALRQIFKGKNGLKEET